MTATASATSESVGSALRPHKIKSAAAIFDDWCGAAHLNQRTEEERHDDFMVRFFSLWAPFGGGDEVDIMTQFGIDRRRFSARLRELALSPRIFRYPDQIQKMLIASIEPNARL